MKQQWRGFLKSARGPPSSTSLRTNARSAADIMSRSRCCDSSIAFWSSSPLRELDAITPHVIEAFLASRPRVRPTKL
jgi:hypothetical protein